jgi:pimeloyl-ACP methyl ester carboxylesterase
MCERFIVREERFCKLISFYYQMIIWLNMKIHLACVDVRRNAVSHCLLFIAMWLSVAITAFARTSDAQSALGRTLKVPLDYSNIARGTAPLYFELGASFDKSKPTVIVVADGQQFFVRRGAVAALQNELFGSAFNVVGIVTRGTTPQFIKASLDPSGQPDWATAWRIFNSAQWINDIESVRKTLVGENGKILLYGRSGGAYLVHQYLQRYGIHVSRVFTQSAVNPLTNRRLNIGVDNFWKEIGDQDPLLQNTLRRGLELHASERLGILMTLQRQHFYVSADRLPHERAELINSLVDDNLSLYLKDRKQYEVDDVTEMSKSNDIIPQNVRVLELILPSGAFDDTSSAEIHPLIESQRHFLEPLLDLVKRGKIRVPPFDSVPAHFLKTEVFVLAGRWDEAVDYRTSIALASMYPRNFLFIADDNHVFSKLTSTGTGTEMLRAFMQFGIYSTEFSAAVARCRPLEWVDC